MKKLIALLIAAALSTSCVATLASCGGDDSSSTKPNSSSSASVPDVPTPPESSDTPVIPPVELEDYYEYGWDDMVIAKGTLTYVKAEAETYGKAEVGELNVQGWNGEINAKQTTHLGENAPYLTAADARIGVEEAGYKYVAIEFALSEGASIGVYAGVPITSPNFKGELAGAIFTDGGMLGRNANFIDDYIDRINVYSEGKQLEYGASAIKAGVWYTIVVELALDTNETLYGADSYITVAMTNGNSKPVYVAGTRYYTNDSFKTDYVTEDDTPDVPDTPVELDDYYEFGADEFVDTKNLEVYAAADGEVNGKTGVYNFTGNGWSNEINAINTTHVGNNAIYADPTAVRANLNAKGYKYIAMDFCLSEGASIRVLGSSIYGTLGMLFSDGAAIAYAGAVAADNQASYFHIYANGDEVKVGDTAAADVWYTVVIELLIDPTGSSKEVAEDEWSTVGFGVGNNKAVYIAGGRYYTNDSFKTDYVDYVSLGADEFVDTKTAEVYVAADGEVNGKTGVYNFTGNGWTNEINALNTTHLGSHKVFETAEDVRANLNAKGYQYIAVEFCLTEGATVRVLGTSIDGTLGMAFTDGAALAYAGAVAADKQEGWFFVYANGEEVAVGDTIEADVWYTVVVKLLLDETGSSQGDATYSTVGFGVGNNKAVYIAGCRYYFNDTFTNDYVTAQAE